jgi:hypothetical protein
MANIILNGAKLKSFSLKPRKRQGSQLSPLLLNIVLKFLARRKKTRKGSKRNTNRKGRGQIILFTDDMILHLQDPKVSTRKLLHLINTFSKGAACRIII